jgi:hypothetical protein
MTNLQLADYSMFEYERRLAERELLTLVGDTNPLGVAETSLLRDRSTYFRAVGDLATNQALVEEAHRQERGTSGRRQATRYLVHGLHEYKGKFNPQMARALINVADPHATALLDPFCGSGTTLIEGMRLGLEVAGVDANPLAAWISRVKAETFQLAGTPGLADRFSALVFEVSQAMAVAQAAGNATAPSAVAGPELSYLHRWFPEPILAALWAGLRICDESNDVLAEVARLTISNIVRQVSWQLPEDLRVRRRPDTWIPPKVAPLFERAAAKTRRALAEVERAASVTSSAAVALASSRDGAAIRQYWPDGRRLVVTSPPYATALPYIDTDRLSIVLLGMGSAPDLRVMERELTGSREWTTAEADKWAERRRANQDALPEEIVGLLETIEQNNLRVRAGFRRMAVPNLLYRYFTHMAETLTALTCAMQPGERVVMVVGCNRTGTGTEAVRIETPRLLGLVSESRGYEFTEQIPLETWARYGMHAKNAVNDEDAVVMTVR